MAERTPQIIQPALLSDLGPLERFVASLIDGIRDVTQIADSTGLDAARVGELLERFVRLGAVRWAQSAMVDAAEGAPSSGVQESSSDGIELDLARRAEIEEAFEHRRTRDHYQKLGVARDVDKAAIRTAYFALSKRFHPDTLFGKELGPYKAKMEAVFASLTDAYSVLGKKKKRRAYDAYLGLTEETSAVEAEITPETPPNTPAAHRKSTLPRQAGPVPSGAVASKVRNRTEAEVRQLKRDLFQKRFGRKRRSSGAIMHAVTEPRSPSSSAPSSTRSSPSGASTSIPAVPRNRQDVLRELTGSLRAAAKVTGGPDRSAAYVRTARAAEEEGDLLAAINAWRLAIATQDVPSFQAEFRRVSLKHATLMANTYEKQAVYEEETRKWAAASLSWRKVAEGREGKPEPRYRGALAIIHSEGDLRHARDLAQEAVDLEPSSARYHTGLARVFIAAGMTSSAKKELQTAQRLDPSDDFVKNLLNDL